MPNMGFVYGRPSRQSSFLIFLGSIPRIARFILQILLWLLNYIDSGCPNGSPESVRGAKLNMKKILDILFVIIV